MKELTTKQEINHSSHGSVKNSSIASARHEDKEPSGLMGGSDNVFANCNNSNKMKLKTLSDTIYEGKWFHIEHVKDFIEKVCDRFGKVEKFRSIEILKEEAGEKLTKMNKEFNLSREICGTCVANKKLKEFIKKLKEMEPKKWKRDRIDKLVGEELTK